MEPTQCKNDFLLNYSSKVLPILVPIWCVRHTSLYFSVDEKKPLNSQSLIPAMFHLSPRIWWYNFSGRLQQHWMWSRRCLSREGVVTSKQSGWCPEAWELLKSVLCWIPAKVGPRWNEQSNDVLVLAAGSSPLVAISAQLKWIVVGIQRYIV